MFQSFSPEFRLIAACSNWRQLDKRVAAIHAAAARPIDWPRLLRVARRHGVIGLVIDGLRKAGLKTPPEVAQQMEAEELHVVRSGLALAAETLRLQRLFDEARIPVVFVKGSALAVLAFGNVGIRQAEDIDLLISPSELPQAVALIRSAGYCRYEPPPEVDVSKLQTIIQLRKDFGFCQQTGDIRLEVHWRLFLNRHAMSIDLPHLNSRMVPLASGVGLRTLGEEDLFAYLCVHGALHSWNRLKWLADVNAILESRSDNEVGLLFCAAEPRGAIRSVVQALLLCSEIFGKPIPRTIADKIDKGVAMRWLKATALEAMRAGNEERQPNQVRFGTTRGSLSTFLLRSTWRYRVAELKTHLVNQTDVFTVPLPQALGFLYPILRFPLWVWRHCKPTHAVQK